jgi:hypothetical protein
MATKKRQAARKTEQQAAPQPEEQPRRRPRPDPSAVQQAWPYDPAAS